MYIEFATSNSENLSKNTCICKLGMASTIHCACVCTKSSKPGLDVLIYM